MPQTLHAVPSPRPEPGGESIRVLIAEGHGLVRAGFRALIEGQADMSVIGEAPHADQALAAAIELRPDVVIIDADIPGGGGGDAAYRILAGTDQGATRVVMLFAQPRDEAVLAAVRAGATGLLLKDAEPDDLVEALRVVAAGDALLAPSLARALVDDFLSRPERLRSTPEQLEELTPREREVVGLVACGLSNEEIAEQLVVTRATAKTHVSRALCKLHARDRAQLVVLAYEAGLVQPGPRWQNGNAPSEPMQVLRSRVEHGLRRSTLQPIAA
jgi:DNA-binding NarL/FixJ family response regulator